MTFKEARRTLCGAITTWGSAIPGGKAFHLWGSIDDAITALDNAAYDRGFTKVYEQRHEALSEEIRQLKQEARYRYGNNVRLHSEIALLKRDHTELQRQFDERGRERDRLQEERAASIREGTQLREERDAAREGASPWHQTAIDRAQEIERLQDVHDGVLARMEALESELADARETICKWADTDINEAYSQADRAHNESHEEADRLRAERDEAQNTIKNLRALVNTELTRSVRRGAELADARETITALQAAVHAANYRAGTISRLRKALETLADRYHAQCCQHEPIHLRRDCTKKRYGVVLAEKALAGESETPRFPGKIDNVVTVNRALTSEEVEEVGHVLFDDRKPEPEIEAVLMGSIETACADGCGRSVMRGNVMYRQVRREPAHRPLYASEACARKAARPKARTHPPYAAYTDAMRREEPEGCGDCGWRGIGRHTCRS